MRRLWKELTVPQVLLLIALLWLTGWLAAWAAVAYTARADAEVVHQTAFYREMLERYDPSLHSDWPALVRQKAAQWQVPYPR